MNFFESELRKIFENESVLKNISFIGRSCFGDLGGDLRARAQFVTSGHADHYDTLKLSVLNRNEGTVDMLALRFGDIFGSKPVPNNPNFPQGVVPHIWTYNNKSEWYAYHLKAADYDVLRTAANEYFQVYRSHVSELSKEVTDHENTMVAGQDAGILPEGNTVWLTVYKDTLGFYDEYDNLTQICVPYGWLLNVLKEEGISPKNWFDEYTADNTDDICQKAIKDGVIMDCTDKRIAIFPNRVVKESVGRKQPLSERIRSARDKSTESMSGSVFAGRNDPER